MALRLGDMHEIRDYLYLGSSRAEAGALTSLTDLGISHVVQVGTNDFMSPSHSGMLTYCCVRALDFEGEDLLNKLKQAGAHRFIDEARAGGGKVLVHCFAGVSRSATTVISYLMAREHLSFEDALVDVVSKRNCVAPNRGFCDQLRILQDQCGGQLDQYRSEMLRGQTAELTIKQWLAVLMRANEKAAELVRAAEAADGTPSAEEQLQRMDLSGFSRRLQERKRLGHEGSYAGVSPPAEADAAVATDTGSVAKPPGPSEEYALKLS